MVTTLNYVPNRGDIVWLSFPETSGHEQKGHRPGLVLTDKEFNKKSGVMFAVPVTSTARGYGTEISVECGGITGVAMVHQMRSVDWKFRRVKFICIAPTELVTDVQSMIISLIES
jgi:mRNA interferase MazF